MYTLIDGRVVREDGYIAIQHRNSNGATHRIGNTIYTFTPQHNVSLGWVSPEHLENVLGTYARICCGQSSKKFFLAGIINVNLFTTGNRNG